MIKRETCTSQGRQARHTHSPLTHRAMQYTSKEMQGPPSGLEPRPNHHESGVGEWQV